MPTPDPADPSTSTSTATSEPPTIAVRIGSFNGLDGKLARLLQLVRAGLRRRAADRRLHRRRHRLS
ncbi:MAG: hypothetical protein R2713_14670 [Ilumatobacteraceae bacterium]